MPTDFPQSWFDSLKSASDRSPSHDVWDGCVNLLGLGPTDPEAVVTLVEDVEAVEACARAGGFVPPHDDDGNLDYGTVYAVFSHAWPAEGYCRLVWHHGQPADAGDVLGLRVL